ncbi:metalloregulator ArsR/SmtB family transcription factor [Priestia megaterium]|nr:metalloregulator ArsR/SmtB family transcription factor [Priestia megaterium]
MQLSRLVNFYKTLGDPTRIRILALLRLGPMHGQAIAGKLGLKPPTITHHMAKLRDIGLIRERREKNTIYFSLNAKNLEASALAILTIAAEQTKHEELKATESERLQVIKNFFTADGKLKQLPAQRKKKIIVLEQIIRGLKVGVTYDEKDINEYLKQFHEDYATLRRELIMNHFMYREHNQYEMNPPELWVLNL